MRLSLKILVIFGLFFGLFFKFILGYIEPAPKKVITIATGSKSGNYYKVALKYKELLEKQNVKLNIINTTGSLENIELLNNNKVDIGFVQGGIIDQSNNKNISSLVSVYYEPLWIFYRNNGYSINYVIELIGKKVAIGLNGSGTQYLSKQILKDNGVDQNNTNFLYLGTNQSKDKLINGEIDAMLAVISPDSIAVNELLSDPNIELLSLKRVKAYDQKYSYLSPLTLYEGTINMYKNLPSENKKILATTANLVCNKNMNDELIRIFLKQVKKVHTTKSIFEQENQFPSLNNLDTVPHDEARKYITNGDSWLESIFPFWIASNIDRLKLLLIPLLTLLFPLLKGFLPIYNWTMRSKIYKWYVRLDKLDHMNNLEQSQIDKNIKELNGLKKEIQSQTKVPLAFKGEYYNLLLHIDLVLKEIKLKSKDIK
jgi:TRAP transporter TAXI family solute receptor